MTAVKAALSTLRVLWGLTWLHIRRRWRSAGGSGKAVLAVLFMVILGAVLSVFLYNLACTMFKLVAADFDPTGALPSAPEGVLAIFLAAGGGVGLLQGVFQANDIIHLRLDLDWLMALPLDRRGVVLSRIAEIAIGTAVTVALLTAPATVAYAWLFGSWHALVLYPVVLVALSTLGSAAAVFVMILVGRLAATTRAQETLGLISSLIAAAVYFLTMLRSRQSPGAIIDELSRGLLRALTGPAAGLAVWLALPFVWPAIALYYATWGPAAGGLLVAVAGTTGTAGAVWLLTAAVAGAYARGRGPSSIPARRGRRPVTAKVPARRLPVGGGPLSALMKRDWVILTRSPRLWQHMAWPLAWAVYMIISIPEGMRAIDPLFIAGLGAAVAALAGGVLSTQSFGVEGTSFYQLATLPLSPLSRVKAKVLIFAAPPAFIGLIVAGFLLWGALWPMNVLRAVVLVVTAALTTTSLGVMLTVGETDFEAVHAGQRQPGPAGCLPALLSMLILGAGFVFLRLSRVLGEAAGITAGTADTLAVALLSVVLLCGLVPGALRRAAATVRAREHGSKPRPELDLGA